MAVRWLRLSTRSLALAAAFAHGFVLESSSSAQAPAVTPAPAAVSGTMPVTSSPGRRLAPDALYVIPAAAEYGETFEGPVDLPLASTATELDWAPPKFPNNGPNYAPSTDTLASRAKSVIFRHDVWAMEFGFKPVRMIAIDIPNAQGEMETKIVWYLLYYVRYNGGDLQPTVSKDQFGNEVFARPEPVAGKTARRFMPGFVMNCSALGKRYQSRFIPQALGPIAEKERVGKPIYDSIAIQRVPIPLSTSRETHDVWGVATWTDIDPRTDFFSVEIRGLTNAQRTVANSERTEAADSGLVSQQKTLVLNFSRPGDTINELADRIRYGVPAHADPEEQTAILSKYGLQERLDHYWVYR